MGIDNSYQSPDSINIIPWENKEKYADLFEYYKQMIAIRRAHKGFRLGSAEAVKELCEFLPTDNKHLIIYHIKEYNIYVLLNGGAKLAEAEIPEGEYTVLAHDAQANVEGLGKIKGGEVVIEPYSATILVE